MTENKTTKPETDQEPEVKETPKPEVETKEAPKAKADPEQKPDDDAEIVHTHVIGGDTYYSDSEGRHWVVRGEKPDVS